MSNFNCDKCGKAIIDSSRGYVTECEHYPIKPNYTSGATYHKPEQESEIDNGLAPVCVHDKEYKK